MSLITLLVSLLLAAHSSMWVFSLVDYVLLIILEFIFWVLDVSIYHIRARSDKLYV